MTDATDASAGGTYTAALCPTTDLDMYMVNAVAGGTISLTTGPISGTAFATDTYLTLYDAAGAVLASNDDGGEGYCSFIQHTPAADGVYYLKFQYPHGLQVVCLITLQLLLMKTHLYILLLTLF